MSKFPKWWNSTITVYNRYEDPTTQQISWYRTVLTDCFWVVSAHNTFMTNSRTQVYDNSILCRIPKQSNYLSAYYWKQLPDKTTNFTLQIGDIVVNGDVNDDIDEYTKGSRSSDLIEKYKDLGIIKIMSLVDNSDITRNIPHYVVSQEI